MAVDTFRYAGFGVESTFHTAVAASFHIDADNLGLDAPDNPEIPIPSGMGRVLRTKKPGYYVSSGNIDYSFDIETIGWFIRWLLNGYQYTVGSAGAPNTHEIYGTNSSTLKSFTVREGKDNFEQIFAGCMMNTLDLNVDTSANLAKATLGIVGGKDTPGTLQDYSSLTLTDAIPLGSAEAYAYIDEEDESAYLKSFRLSMNNGIDTRSAQRFGSMYPQGGFIPTARTVSFTATLVFEDRRHKNLFWGSDTGPATTGSTETPITLKLIDPDLARMLTVCQPRCHIQSVKLPTRGTDTLIQEITGRAMLASAVTLKDESLIDTDVLVTLLNNTTTMA